MRWAFEQIELHGQPNKSTKGNNRELAGVLLEITDPRARLSRTETRGKPFSCLGELFWFLAKTNEVSFIEYYIREYQQLAEDGAIYGG